MLSGHAHREVVRLRIEGASGVAVDKTLRARRSGEPLPITYENAYGGIGSSDNPLGQGHPDGVAPLTLAGAPARVPAVLGAIPRAFSERRKPLTGLRDGDVGAVLEVPDDFDWQALQCAPRDQRPAQLQGDERVHLTGLDAYEPELSVELPGGRCVARLYGAAEQGLPSLLVMRLDMLVIDADTKRVSCIWRAVQPIAREAVLSSLAVAGGFDHPDTPVAWPDANELDVDAPPTSAADAVGVSGNLQHTMDMPLGNRRNDFESTLPFTGHKSAAAANEAHTLEGTVVMSPAGTPRKPPPPPRRARSAPSTPLPGAPWDNSPERPVARPQPSFSSTLPEDADVEVPPALRGTPADDEEAELDATRMSAISDAEAQANAARAKEREKAQQAEAEQRAKEEKAAKEEEAKRKAAHEAAEARRREERERFEREEREAAEAAERRKAEREAQTKERADQLRKGMYGGFKSKR